MEKILFRRSLKPFRIEPVLGKWHLLSMAVVNLTMPRAVGSDAESSGAYLPGTRSQSSDGRPRQAGRRGLAQGCAGARPPAPGPRPPAPFHFIFMLPGCASKLVSTLTPSDADVGALPQIRDLFIRGCSLGPETWKIFPSDSNVQTCLGACQLELTRWEKSSPVVPDFSKINNYSHFSEYHFWLLLITNNLSVRPLAYCF